ncbi:MAG: RNA polymerase sigma factor [Phycisphaerales bacterium]|nr:MAG: RNA polymerase sigma factor [Phycisphaerales bacterium]
MAQRFEREFRRFWEQTRERVRAYMFCACSNATDADDLAQECYLRALRSWDCFDGKGTRQAWLFAIARNTRVDWFRKRGREARLVAADEVTHVREISEPVADEVEMIWRAVGNLGPECQETIHLRFAADLSYAEIAELLGVPVGTVRSRLHRGLKAVRERIEEQDHGT